MEYGYKHNKKEGATFIGKKAKSEALKKKSKHWIHNPKAQSAIEVTSEYNQKKWDEKHK